MSAQCVSRPATAPPEVPRQSAIADRPAFFQRWAVVLLSDRMNHAGVVGFVGLLPEGDVAAFEGSSEVREKAVGPA